LYNPSQTFPAFQNADVRVMHLNRIGAFRRNHRAALPFLARSFSKLKIDADLIVCSSSGWAHGASCTGRKIVYCHTPARWLYQASRYLGDGHRISAAALTVLAPRLRKWDRSAAKTADLYIANSSVVRERIQQTYGIEAQLLPPPHTINADGPRDPAPGLTPPFLLCVTRLLPYKNVACLIEAFAKLPHHLVIVGTGPEAARLRSMAPGNVHFLGNIPDEQLRWLYANCEGLLAPGHEDLGLAPLEAAAFGKPVAALRWGGFLDTVNEGVTGVFFDRPEPDLVMKAIAQLRADPFDAEAIRRHAEQFNESAFMTQLRSLAELVVSP